MADPRLRRLLAEGKFVAAPGVFEMITARIAENIGFDAVYVTGYGTVASHLGLPDAGLATYTDMLSRIGRICELSSVPVIADADTGYGGLLNVQHTVRGYEKAGVTAIQIEDQEFPKKCGHTPYRRVIPLEDMVRKIQVAADARQSEDFLIIARTDARGAVDLDEAIRRGRLYHEAGADMIFPDALLSEQEYRRFAAEVPGPKLFNMGGYGKRRTTPKLPLQTVESMGYAVVIFPLAALRAGVKAYADFLAGLRDRGVDHELQHMREVLAGHPVDNWYEFTGAGDIRALEERYLPDDEVARKYAATAGHMPGDR